MHSPTAEASAPFDPFASIIATQAAHNPQGEALRVDDRALDWQTLHRHGSQVARALLCSGIAPGDRVAVVGAGPQWVTPCGGCRQKLREFAAPDTPVLIASPQALHGSMTMEELLPRSFGPDNLGAGA